MSATLRLVSAIFLLPLVLLLATCSMDDGDSTDDGPSNSVDAITSATPDVASAQLTKDHEGWMKADCSSCHESTHSTTYRVPDCVLCHGRNGAPDRAAGHEDKECAKCHANAHSKMELDSPASCRKCHHYQTTESAPCGNTESVDAVVIGAGGGGLAAAAALARAGKKTVLLEQQYKLGGQMGVIKRGSYNIELSLHSMSGLSDGLAPAQMFEDLGIWDDLKPVTLDPLFGILSVDDNYMVPADVDAYLKLLQEQFPNEAANLDALFKELIRLSALIESAMVFMSTGELPPNFTMDDLTEIQEILSTNVSEFVYGYIESPRLFSVVTSLTVYIGKLPQEMSALTFVAMWKGFHLDGLQYVEGGSERIIQALAKEIENSGSTIELLTKATKIVIDQGKATQVQTHDGRCFDTKYVVSNANAPDTLFKMVGEEHLPEDYVSRVKGMEISPSMFVIYLGVDHDYVPNFGGSHELFWAEYADEQTVLDRILECSIHEVGFAMTNYSVVDPNAAPAGKNVITIITMLPYDCFDEWQWNVSHDAYKKKKKEVADVILEKANAILPGLTTHIEVMEIATPKTIGAYTLNPQGCILGWSDSLEQNILTRLEQQTPIPNLWLAGAWTNPGGGQQYVLSSGLTAAQKILENP